MRFLNSKTKTIKELMIKNQHLIKQNRYLAQQNQLKEVKIQELLERIGRLINRCDMKDACFTEVISDGLRHHSSTAARYMVDRREFLRGKR